MRISTIMEMAAKQFCPDCGRTMAANHYWYKGGWKCKGRSKLAPGQTFDQLPPSANQGNTMPQSEVRSAVPNGFAEMIAQLQFGSEIKLKDGTLVRYLGGGKDAKVTEPGITLYPVRVASGPDAGMLLMIRPDEFNV